MECAQQRALSMFLACICASEQSLYFSTQQRVEAAFTGRSRILSGALEECLASGLLHWPRSVWMMSHGPETKTYIRASARPKISSALFLLQNQRWKKSALLWTIIPLQRFQGRGQRLSTGPPESERFSMVAHEHKGSPTRCNRSHDPVQLDGHHMV